MSLSIGIHKTQPYHLI